MTKPFFVLLILFSFVGELALGAPCCGGTANIPSLISGDDSSQISTTLISSQVVAEAPVGGGIKYRKDNDQESAQTLKIDGATILSDRWQTGITIPVTRRARSRATNESAASGLGDISLNVGYEALPDWTYSSWRPKGIVFLTATLPTGGSIYEAKELYRIDSRGRGFYSLSAGALILKNWGVWDASIVAEAHHPFNRTISNEAGELNLQPGWGTSGSLALGLSPMGGDFRIGVSVSPSYESPITTAGLVSGQGEKVSLWTSSAQLSYMVNDLVSMSLTYSDQTLIKASNNSALNRTVAFLMQKRWER
jgi:hypothetical protein